MLPGESVKATARFSLLSESRIFLLGLLSVISGFMLRKYASIPSGFSLSMILTIAFAFYAATRGLKRAISLAVKFSIAAYIIDLVLDIQPWLPVPRHGMKIDLITVLLGFCEKVAWLLFSNHHAGLWWMMIVSHIGFLLIILGFFAVTLGLIRARKAEAVVTDRRLIVRKGVVFQNETSIPLSAVVTVTAYKRLVGGGLKLGLKASSFKIEGLKNRDLTNLYCILTSTITGGS